MTISKIIKKILSLNETVRLHVNKNGKVIALPYEISFINHKGW